MIVLPPGLNAGDTVYCFFDTYDSAGASVTITGLAVTDIEVYKNGSVTQRASDNGYTLLDTDGIDFDGATGLQGFSVDTSDNSDASFWTDGAQYLIHVNAITVDGQTVRFSFMLWLGYLLRPTTAGRKLDVSSSGEAGLDWANIGSPTTSQNLSGTSTKALEPTTAGRTLDVSTGGEAGIDWANVGTPGSTVNLSATTVKDATDVNTDTDTLLSRMGTPSDLGGGATLSANLSDIEAETDDWNDGQRLDLLLDAIKAKTDLLPTAITGTVAASPTPTSTSFKTDIASSAYTADAFNDQIIRFLSGTLLGQTKPILDTTLSGGFIVIDVDEAFTTAPTAGDAFEIIADHVHPVSQIQSGLATSSALGTAQTGITAIQAKTDNLPADPADASDIAASFSITTSAISALNNLSQADIRTAVGLASANMDTQLTALAALMAASAIRTAVGLATANLDSQLSGIQADLPLKLVANTAYAGFTFPMVDSSGDPATGLTVTAQRSIDGAAFASCANAVAEISGGAYSIDLADTDLNGNNFVMLRLTATGAKTRFILLLIQRT